MAEHIRKNIFLKSFVCAVFLWAVWVGIEHVHEHDHEHADCSLCPLVVDFLNTTFYLAIIGLVFLKRQSNIQPKTRCKRNAEYYTYQKLRSPPIQF